MVLPDIPDLYFSQKTDPVPPPWPLRKVHTCALGLRHLTLTVAPWPLLLASCAQLEDAGYVSLTCVGGAYMPPDPDPVPLLAGRRGRTRCAISLSSARKLVWLV